MPGGMRLEKYWEGVSGRLPDHPVLRQHPRGRVLPVELHGDDASSAGPAGAAKHCKHGCSGRCNTDVLTCGIIYSAGSSGHQRKKFQVVLAA